MEEVGYRVEPSEVHELSAAVAAAGVNGSTSHQFYAMVSEKCVREVVGRSEECECECEKGTWESEDRLLCV